MQGSEQAAHTFGLIRSLNLIGASVGITIDCPVVGDFRSSAQERVRNSIHSKSGVEACFSSIGSTYYVYSLETVSPEGAP